MKTFLVFLFFAVFPQALLAQSADVSSMMETMKKNSQSAPAEVATEHLQEQLQNSKELISDKNLPMGPLNENSVLLSHGGSSDGGGSLCVSPDLNQGRALFLDLALFNATIIDDPSSGEKLDQTKLGQDIGYDMWDVSLSTSLQYALSRVRDWESHAGSTRSMSLLEKGLLSVQYIKTSFVIDKLSRVSLPSQSRCQMSDLKTVALYKNGFVNISIPAWNQLGIYSQAALLIHEGLRNIQISQELGGSDLDLETLTAIIVSGYNSQVQLDKQSFFSKYIQKAQISQKAACQITYKFYSLYPFENTDLKKQHLKDLCTEEIHTETSEQITTALNRVGLVLQDLEHFTGVKTVVTQEYMDRAYTSFKIVDLSNGLVHQQLSNDDFIFRNATIQFTGAAANIDMTLIQRKIQSHQVTSQDLEAARQNYKNYLESP